MYTRDYLLSLEYFVENEYFDAYISLVEENASREFVSCETNSHHIIPRHYFADRSLDTDNSADNKVNLLYKDHMLAHMYLSACTTGRDRYRNLYAISYMSGQPYVTDSDLNYVKENLNSYQELYRAAIDAAPNHWKGKKRPESTRKKMSEAQRGRQSFVKGKVWVNNGVVNKAIDGCELDTFIADGWTRGRHVTVSEESLAKMDAARRKPRSAEFCEKMRKIALTQPAHSKETLEKHSAFMKEYYRTHDNPFKGRHHTEESKQKFRESFGERRAINKDGVCRVVKVEELSVYIEDGWTFGKPKREDS